MRRGERLQGLDVHAGRHGDVLLQDGGVRAPGDGGLRQRLRGGQRRLPSADPPCQPPSASSASAAGTPCSLTPAPAVHDGRGLFPQRHLHEWYVSLRSRLDDAPIRRPLVRVPRLPPLADHKMRPGLRVRKYTSNPPLLVIYEPILEIL